MTVGVGQARRGPGGGEEESTRIPCGLSFGVSLKA
jgi:hypothetical protein